MLIFKNNAIPEITAKTANRLNTLKRIPQCVMLTGSNETVKSKCAFELAAAVICEDKNSPCGKCPACKKVFAGTHPDITLIQPTEKRKNVSIEDIRSGISERLYISPNEAPNRVFILTGASDYSPIIQNALLKTIEEPPDDCMFIILCDQRNDMLSTITSRSFELYIGEAPDAKPKAKDIKADETAAAFAKAIAKQNEFEMLATTAEIGKERDIFSKSLEKLRLIIRDALVYGTNAEPMSGHRDIAYSLSAEYSVPELTLLKKITDDVSNRTEINCNVSLTAAFFSSETGKVFRKKRSNK